MSSKPILLLITATNCSACVSFKEHVWGEAKQKIESLGTVELKQIDLPSTNSQLPQSLPADVKRYVGWFPTLILVSSSSWNRGGNSKLDAEVFNGSFVNDVITHGRGNAPYGTNTKGVLDWLSACQQKPIFAFSGGGNISGMNRSGGYTNGTNILRGSTGGFQKTGVRSGLDSYSSSYLPPINSVVPFSSEQSFSSDGSEYLSDTRGSESLSDSSSYSSVKSSTESVGYNRNNMNLGSRMSGSYSGSNAPIFRGVKYYPRSAK